MLLGGRLRLVLMTTAALLLLAACVSGSPRGAAPTTAAQTGPDPVIAAAGDIACDPTYVFFKGGAGTAQHCNERETSDLLIRGHFAAVLPLGDDQYQCGSLSAFRRSYAPSWGRLMRITHPVIGNHEYGRTCHANNPSGYFAYFGREAANPRGYYSFDVGTWHVIVLDSECHSGTGKYQVGGCATGSPQETWLRHDLATHQNKCTLAAWHEPRFSSGEHGDSQQMADLWNDLAAAHVDVVLSGHDHDYERFAPIGRTPALSVLESSTSDPAADYQEPSLSPDGIREFVVGTGGRNHYPFRHPPLHGEIVRNDTAFGVLALTLHPTSYDWKFLAVPGASFTDQGHGVCH